MGHNVVMTANGEECYHSFSKSCADYDAILMDMQVCCRQHHQHHHHHHDVISHPITRSHTSHRCQ